MSVADVEARGKGRKPLKKKKPDTQGFAASQQNNAGMQNLSLLTSNLAQLKTLIFTEDFFNEYELRLLLISLLAVSILMQLVSKSIMHVVSKAKVFSPENVDYADDADHENEEDQIKRRNAKIRQASRLTGMANGLAFGTTIVNIIITTFAFTE
ncbi:uncharacterized protein LOC135496185 [Lineus longissimus]|uniref:uncharacterized protein LOC135496185 n=1 Tax=Lineus longissimus TaxID=88925 RepID=UPI002B4C41D7